MKDDHVMKMYRDLVWLYARTGYAPYLNQYLHDALTAAARGPIPAFRVGRIPVPAEFFRLTDRGGKPTVEDRMEFIASSIRKAKRDV